MKIDMKFKVFAALLFSAAFFSCTKPNGPTSKVTELTLSSDVSSIIADGKASARFYVMANTGKDVTSSAEYYVNGQVLETNQFSTSQSGDYKVVARYEGITSNEIVIKAMDKDLSSVKMKLSKETIYPDGGDISYVTVLDANGNDVTSDCTFSCSDAAVKIDGRKISVKTDAATARYSIKTVINSVEVASSPLIASSSLQFSKRLLVEEITRTACQYCPANIRVLQEIAADNPLTVVAYNVHNSRSQVYAKYFSQKSKDFSDAYCTFALGEDNPDRLTAAPKSYHNRDMKNIEATANELRDKAKSSSDRFAIAMESSSTTKSISGTVTIGGKDDINGKLVVVLVEDGIKEYQQGMGEISMYHVMKGYYPDHLGKSFSIKSGAPAKLDFSFDLSSITVQNVNECQLIAFITDDSDSKCKAVQFSHIGEVKGY